MPQQHDALQETTRLNVPVHQGLRVIPGAFANRVRIAQPLAKLEQIPINILFQSNNSNAPTIPTVLTPKCAANPDSVWILVEIQMLVAKMLSALPNPTEQFAVVQLALLDDLILAKSALTVGFHKLKSG